MSRSTADAHSIRPATLADVPAILHILAASPSAPQWSAAEFHEILTSSTADQPLQRAVWIAEAADSAAGFAVSSVLRSVHPAEAELENVAVLPGCRGQGLGRALVETVATWSAACGADALRLEVRAGNAPARSVYAAAGFVPSGRRPGYYANPTEDAVCMTRTIHPVGNKTGVA